MIQCQDVQETFNIFPGPYKNGMLDPEDNHIGSSGVKLPNENNTKFLNQQMSDIYVNASYFLFNSTLSKDGSCSVPKTNAVQLITAQFHF